MTLEIKISIHALLAESDSSKDDTFAFVLIISIHALLAESDQTHSRHFAGVPAFLSTLSLRRATGCQRPCAHPTTNFYPRSPCGERQTFGQVVSSKLYFYPRSPCGERRHGYSITLRLVLLFLSTLSLRRATGLQGNRHNTISISIHALLAESDGRHSVNCQARQEFLSTLSLRRATFIGPLIFSVQPHFYPRSPCGERPKKNQGKRGQIQISIHALLAESDFGRAVWPGLSL